MIKSDNQVPEVVEWNACDAEQSTPHICDLVRRQETISENWLRHDPGSNIGTPTGQGSSLGWLRRWFLDLPTFIVRHPTAPKAQIETDTGQALMCRIPCLRCPLALHASLAEFGIV